MAHTPCDRKPGCVPCPIITLPTTSEGCVAGALAWLCPIAHRYLDEKYPEDAPHAVYAYYARAFAVPTLRALYAELCAKHAVDLIVVIDGGSDSLMIGDEAGLGDPIEDCVSVTAARLLAEDPQCCVRDAVLISVGLGCDRFNDVSDAASLRAIAEITQLGGFLGSISLEVLWMQCSCGPRRVAARQAFSLRNSALFGLEHSPTLQTLHTHLIHGRHSPHGRYTPLPSL